ncbi:MAG: ABC transporter ATP-binding protein, partial [Acetobacteraceae bacterium]|nr:ABC transporter ATP-binding protein [Acetobacteraceae bacterium]
MALLEVENLTVRFFLRDGVVPAVEGVSLAVERGEVLGLVGESGAGKSVTGLAILGLTDPPGRLVAGSIRFGGEQLAGRPDAELRRLRGRKLAMVFQDPMTTLNPVLRVDTQMVEAVMAHERVSR